MMNGLVFAVGISLLDGWTRQCNSRDGANGVPMA